MSRNRSTKLSTLFSQDLGLRVPPIPRPRSSRDGWIWLIVVAAVWGTSYFANEHLWTWIFTAFGFNIEETLPGAVHFFFYDTAKVLLLLVGMIFGVGLLRTSLRPETVREYLLDKPLLGSLVLAALLGAVTPFCSCSSIPLFIGFVAAGVPLSVTLTFLAASPLVNEVAVVLLLQSFGWQITVAYVVAGLTLSVLLGAVLSRFQLDDQVMEFVWETPTARLHQDGASPTLVVRIDAAIEETAEIIGRVWKWVIVGVGAGAIIHGWVPAETLTAYAGPDNPFAVLIVTVLGIPLYSNAAGVVPIAEALWDKGMATGTVLSFMMATVALSFPEFVLLKNVLRNKLLGIFFGSIATGIVLIGFGFNFFA